MTERRDEDERPGQDDPGPPPNPYEHGTHLRRDPGWGEVLPPPDPYEPGERGETPEPDDR